jgi:thiamine pyrophosphokinase
MSSHHIVREKQEPALLITHADGFDVEWLGQLLEWSPTVLANGACWPLLQAWDIKVDVLLQVPTNAPTLQANCLQLPVNNGYVLPAAMQYLLNNAYPAVNIVTDAFNAANYWAYLALINLAVLTPTQKIYPVTTGFNKWLPQGQQLCLVSEVNHLQTTGLNPTGNPNIFTCAADGFVSITFSNDWVFIAEPLV